MTMTGLCVWLDKGCDEPPLLAHGDVTWSSSDVNSTANYSCHDGYELHGASQLSCHINASWISNTATSYRQPSCSSESINVMLCPLVVHVAARLFVLTVFVLNHVAYQFHSLQIPVDCTCDLLVIVLVVFCHWWSSFCRVKRLITWQSFHVDLCHYRTLIGSHTLRVANESLLCCSSDCQYQKLPLAPADFGTWRGDY